MWNVINLFFLFFCCDLPDSSFLRALASSEQVAFNEIHKTLTFINPYENVRDAEALRMKIIFDGGTTGTASLQSRTIRS